ncbi:hypothetical protein BLNAU_16985 [Blattamonas nauphoetae]|uniref:Uncharacterized protein n=1 Tax=Blattamonas nauphoetae TaxID=2049346 RepID=A0ABQ9X7T0_9EUKA|nr:hypothetical protein BLNAU_16985 [Blattamonas nauphoetae]
MEQANPSQETNLTSQVISSDSFHAKSGISRRFAQRTAQRQTHGSFAHRQHFSTQRVSLASPLLRPLILQTGDCLLHLLPDISSQIKSLAYQMTSIQNYAFDVLPALAQVKQTITNQRIPPLARTFRSQYASSQLHPSHIAKLVVTADVQNLHTRLIRNPLRSLFMPVFRDAILPASHPLTVGQSVISDIPSYSLNSSSPASIINGNAFHEDTLHHQQRQSTLTTQDNSVDEDTQIRQFRFNSVRRHILHSRRSSCVDRQRDRNSSSDSRAHRWEGTEQTGRGFGHLLMPDRTAISTQTLLDHRHKSCQAFIEAARVFSNEQGRMGFCGIEMEKQNIEKGRNRATVEETIDNPFETTTEEAQEVVRRVFTAHFTRLLHSADPASISKTSSSNTLHKVSTTTQPSPLLPPDIDFADCDDPDIILLRDCFKDVSLPSHLPIDQAAEESCAIAKPQLRENDRSRRFLTISTPSLSTFQRSSCSPLSTLNPSALPPIRSVEAINSDETTSPHACRQSLNCAAQHRRAGCPSRGWDSSDIVCGAPQLAAHPHLTRPEEDLVVPQPVQQVRGHRIVDPGNSAEKKIVITEPDNKHIHFTPVGNVTVDCEHSTKKPAAKFGPPIRLPILFFKTTDGSITVRPSMRTTPILSATNSDSPVRRLQVRHASLLLSPVLKASSSIPVAPVVTEVTEAYSSKRPHTARRVFFTALDGTACWVTARTMKNATPPKRNWSSWKKLKEKKLKKERIAEQEIDEARRQSEKQHNSHELRPSLLPRLKQSLRNYKSPLSAGLLVSPSGHTHHDVDTDRADITRIAPDIAVHPPSSLRHQTQRHGIRRAAPKEGSVSTSLLKPTANNKPVRVSRQSRLLSYASLIALTPSPRPSPSNGASRSAQPEPTLTQPTPTHSRFSSCAENYTREAH